MSRSSSITLTSSERAVYQALVARGVPKAYAIEDALDGVTLAEARKVSRNSRNSGPSQAEIDAAITSIKEEL